MRAPKINEHRSHIHRTPLGESKKNELMLKIAIHALYTAASQPLYCPQALASAVATCDGNNRLSQALVRVRDR